MTNELWFDLEKAAREEAADRFRHVSLEKWDLSARAKNALLRSNPNMSIGDVLCAGPEIAATRGLGRAALQELHLKAMAFLDDSGTAGMAAFVDASHAFEETEEQQRALPDEILDLPVGLLQLDKRTHASLQHREISTIGEVVDAMMASTRPNITIMPPSQLESVKAAISNLCVSISPAGQPNWQRYYHLQGISLIPSDLSEPTSPSEIIQSLSSAFKGIVLTENDDRMWYIVQRRYGLQRTDSLTLNDLGEAFGLTRERVRQIEAKGLESLRRRFVEQDYTGKDYRVQPAILEHVNQLAVIPLHDGDNITRESELRGEVQARYGDAAGGSWPEISLIFVLSGFDRVEFNATDLDPVWTRKGALDVDALRLQVEELDRLLTVEQPLPLDELDILRHLNARLAKKGARKLGLPELRKTKRICSSIEERPDGSLWGKFEYLRGRGNQVERLLFESGEPLSMREIVRRLNHRLVKAKQRRVTIETLSNQISCDERFMPIGRSGYWGLRSWSHIETAKVIDLMEQCLTALDRPGSVDELYEYVSKRRPVQRSSIVLYLGNDARFAKMGANSWGLAAWPEAETAQAWNRTQVAQFLTDLFRRHNAKELDYETVRQELMDAAGVGERHAQGMLNANLIVKTRVISGGRRVATLRPRFRDALRSSGKQDSHRSMGWRDQIPLLAQEYLEAAPDQTMPNSDLVSRISDQLDCAPSTVSARLTQLEFVTRKKLPNGRVLCTLKRQATAGNYQQVSNIANAELRAKVERALPYLAIDSVDIGMFLLSKEFEATLKNYVVAAANVGRLSSTLGPDPSKWKLAGIVDLVTKEGLITDKTILHWLREERNSRAHGSMPSLAERQVLMNNAPYLASLYIDYIRLFDDLRRGLDQ